MVHFNNFEEKLIQYIINDVTYYSKYFFKRLKYLLLVKY